MAGHALYGMALCFGHTGVTFDAENDNAGPGVIAYLFRRVNVTAEQIR